MRKKTKNRGSKSSDLAPRRATRSLKQKLHDFVEKIQQYLLTVSFVIGLLKIRDEISEKLRQLILGFFDFLSPCWTFLFIHKSKRNKKIERVIETIAPNPFADVPSDNGQTSSKSHGSKIMNFLRIYPSLQFLS